MATANAQIGVAVAAYYPTVTLSASGSSEASSLSKWLSWPSRFWSVGPSIPSEDRFRRRSEARADRNRRGRSMTRDVRASYRETVLTGFQEVEDNLAALRILDEEAQSAG